MVFGRGPPVRIEGRTCDQPDLGIQIAEQSCPQLTGIAVPSYDLMASIAAMRGVEGIVRPQLQISRRVPVYGRRWTPAVHRTAPVRQLADHPAAYAEAVARYAAGVGQLAWASL
jgi:hypothetical protein